MEKDIAFILEVENLKNIKRRSRHLFDDEHENDAEHSFHISLMAYVLREYFEEEINMERVVEMLLCHDLVEIYAGDTFAYDTKGYESKAQREEEASEKLYSILDDKKASYYKNLWKEFEDGTSSEARYAACLDRLQPMLLNYHRKGGTWKEYGTTRKMVDKRAEKIREASPKFREFIDNLLDDAVRKGYLDE